MQRSKVYAVLAALVMATATAVVLAGTASAAQWHVYEGDVFAGHAYGLDVPARSQSVEFVFDGAEAGAASLAVYAPDGSRVGFYDLSQGLTTASVSDPDEGRYVAYVYDIQEGALDIRVQSKDAPAKLDLEELDLAREDVTIGTFEQGKLDQVITSDLKIQPVFVTLLYEGSARDLDATVASEKGNVVVIQDETATAFQPGVWTSLKGARTFHAANLDGTTFTTEVHAASFEGTMVLTTLGLDLRAPDVEQGHVHMPAPPAPPGPPQPAKPARAPAEKSTFQSSDAQFALEEGVALAFAAPKGVLVLADLGALDEDGDGNESYGDGCQPQHGLVSIYAPDDSVLAVVKLSHDEPTVEVELPAAGEYVLYAHHVQGEAILAMIEGAKTAPAVRQLALEEVEMTFSVASDLLMGSEAIDVELEFVPVDLALRYGDGLGLLSWMALENEDGVAASTSALATTGGLVDPFTGTSTAPEFFAKGAHTLSTSGTYEGDVTLVVTHFLRSAEAPALVPAKHAAHDEHDAEDETEEEAEPSGAEATVAEIEALVYGLFPQ